MGCNRIYLIKIDVRSELIQGKHSEQCFAQSECLCVSDCHQVRAEVKFTEVKKNLVDTQNLHSSIN